MSTIDPQPPGDEPPTDAVLAGEYVLGVLDANARAQVKARIEREPAFAALVQAWATHLAPLLEELETAPVPAHVWARIEAELDAARRGTSTATSTPAPWWRQVWLWQATTAAAVAALAVVWITRPLPVAEPPAPAPVVVAPEPDPTPAPAPAPDPVARPVTLLAQDDGAPAWLATVDADHGVVQLTPVPARDIASDRVPELWLIPDGEAPRSLGVVSGDRAHSVEVPAALRHDLVTGATLAISLEPQGGSPEAGPTGPVIAHGAIAAL